MAQDLDLDLEKRLYDLDRERIGDLDDLRIACGERPLGDKGLIDLMPERDLERDLDSLFGLRDLDCILEILLGPGDLVLDLF